MENRTRSISDARGGEGAAALFKRSAKDFLQVLFLNRYVLFHGDRSSTAVALTFDDGPHPRYTPAVLDVLKRFGARATFFLVGEEMEKYPGVVDLILGNGHQIANHSFHHRNMTGRRDGSDPGTEIRAGAAAVETAARAPSPWFRPPWGRVSLPHLLSAVLNGYRILMWSRDSFDCEKESAELIMSRINSRTVKNGDIILFHDDNAFTVEALPAVIEDLRGSGYRFVTISELFDGHRAQRAAQKAKDTI